MEEQKKEKQEDIKIPEKSLPERIADIIKAENGTQDINEVRLNRSLLGVAKMKERLMKLDDWKEIFTKSSGDIRIRCAVTHALEAALVGKLTFGKGMVDIDLLRLLFPLQDWYWLYIKRCSSKEEMVANLEVSCALLLLEIESTIEKQEEINNES